MLVLAATLTAATVLFGLLLCSRLGKPFYQKIPAPIKIRLALPPPFKKNNYPPPTQRGILWAGGFSRRMNQQIPGAQKWAQPFPAPELRVENLQT